MQVKLNLNQFFSALNNKLQTCCHPEFLLNKKYQNVYTKLYDHLWDKIYTGIQTYFGNPDQSTKAMDINREADGSVLFELLERAAKERNDRTSEQMRDLVAGGDHPWQQPHHKPSYGLN